VAGSIYKYLRKYFILFFKYFLDPVFVLVLNILLQSICPITAAGIKLKYCNAQWYSPIAIQLVYVQLFTGTHKLWNITTYIAGEKPI